VNERQDSRYQAASQAREKIVFLHKNNWLGGFRWVVVMPLRAL
jgi:hypothetical protein